MAFPRCNSTYNATSQVIAGCFVEGVARGTMIGRDRGAVGEGRRIRAVRKHDEWFSGVRGIFAWP